MFKKINFTKKSKLISKITFFSICFILLQILTFSSTSVTQFGSNDIFNVQSNKLINNQKSTILISSISISGNLDFEVQANSNGWAGNGTKSNPYVIENLNVTTDIYSMNAFSIKNTDVFFILRNNILRIRPASPSYGLYMENVTNGKIVNNSAEFSHIGMYLLSSNNNIFINNTVNSNNYGMYLWYSNNNIIKNNFANSNNNGMYLWHSNNNTLTNNTANSNYGPGLYLWDSSSNTIVSNSFQNKSIQIKCFSVSSCSQTLVEDNTINGLELLFLQHASNQTITRKLGQILLLNASFITIENQIINNLTNYAVMLFFSNYNTINNISVKFSQGFFIENSHGNIFTNNSVISSLGYGFDLYYSQNSIFRKNIANSNYIGFRFT